MQVSNLVQIVGLATLQEYTTYPVNLRLVIILGHHHTVAVGAIVSTHIGRLRRAICEIIHARLLCIPTRRGGGGC